MTNLTHNSLFYMFISILHVFRATSCSSSGESIVSIQHLVYVTPCRWPSSMQVGKFLPDPHTRQSPTQSDTYWMLYWYIWFSWWWARGYSKRVQNWNKHIEKGIVCQVGRWQKSYQDARSTGHKMWTYFQKVEINSINFATFPRLVFLCEHKSNLSHITHIPGSLYSCLNFGTLKTDWYYAEFPERKLTDVQLPVTSPAL
jgi:hypothetical protein